MSITILGRNTVAHIMDWVKYTFDGYGRTDASYVKGFYKAQTTKLKKSDLMLMTHDISLIIAILVIFSIGYGASEIVSNCTKKKAGVPNE